MKINNLILDRDLITVHGKKNFGDNEHSFLLEQSQDLKIFTNADILKKYKTYGKNTGSRINFILCNGTMVNLSLNEEKYNHICSKYEHLLSNNTFNVIFAGNFSGCNYIPFTPWMLFHRTFHALQTMTVGDFNLEPFSEEVSNLLVGMHKELFDVYKNHIPENFHKSFINCDFGENPEPHIPSWIYPFKSAKDRLIDVDLSAELFAQFCTNGKITLTKKLPNFLSESEKSYVMKIHKKYEELLTDLFIIIEQNMNGKTLTY